MRLMFLSVFHFLACSLTGQDFKVEVVKKQEVFLEKSLKDLFLNTRVIDLKKSPEGVTVALDSMIISLNELTGSVDYIIDFKKYVNFKPKRLHVEGEKVFVLNSKENKAFCFNRGLFLDSVMIHEQLDWYAFFSEDFDRFRWSIRQFIGINSSGQSYSSTKFPFIVNLVKGQSQYFSITPRVLTSYNISQNWSKDFHVIHKGLFHDLAYSFNGCINDSLFAQKNRVGVPRLVNPFIGQYVSFKSNTLNGANYHLVGIFNEQPVYPTLDIYEDKIYLINVINGVLYIYQIKVN